MLLPVYCMAQDYAAMIEEHRKKYISHFLEDEKSPVKSDDVKYIKFFPASEVYNITCTFTASDDTSTFDMMTYSGKKKKYSRYGHVDFQMDTLPLRLYLYESESLKNTAEYAGYLFLPFKDPTNGVESYGGGRYLDLQKSDIIDNKVTIDFNKAYNPYCAYSEGYSCPIPPSENHLPVKVEAGEMNFQKDH